MQSFGKITQKDIAKKLGVSVSLVSRVLSGQGEKVGISQRKIQAVMEAARESHYVPLSAALALKGKKTRTLGIVVYDFHDPFFGKLIAQLQGIAHKMDYSLLLVGFVNRVPEATDLAPLYKHFVDGIIILGSYGKLDWLENFRNIPVVRIGRGEDERISYAISIDENDAAEQIVRHLKFLGKRKFFYVSRDISIHELRWNATLAAAKKQDCKIARSDEKSFASDFEAGHTCASKVVMSGEDIDAFICSTDVAAMGVIKSLYELGKRVPEDYAVVGFDDIPAAGNYIPAITSMRQPVDVFARNVMDFLSDAQKGGETHVKGSLIIRESSAGRKI